MSRSIYDKTNKVRIPISGAEIPNVDSSLSTTSENPVQNKVIKGALDNKQDILTLDETPTQNSANFVTSGSIYSYINSMVTQSIDDSY